MVSVLIFVFIIGAKMSEARLSVAPAPIRDITVEAIDEGSEPAHDPYVEETTESVPSDGGANIIIILAGQCKTVEYTQWSACNKNFGLNGFQFRDIVRPTLGNCLPTGIQQSETVRECK